MQRFQYSIVNGMNGLIILGGSVFIIGWTGHSERQNPPSTFLCHFCGVTISRWLIIFCTPPTPHVIHRNTQQLMVFLIDQNVCSTTYFLPFHIIQMNGSHFVYPVSEQLAARIEVALPHKIGPSQSLHD